MAGKYSANANDEISVSPFVQAMADINRERQAQNAKWGEQFHDDKTWLAILMEECGELAQAILHDEFGGKAAGTAFEELTQVAAVAVQWMEYKIKQEQNK